LGAAFALSAPPASARTLRECNAAYAADKAAIKLSGQTKAAYVAACRAESPAPPDPSSTPPPADPMAPKPIMRF
jgi:hypothetical protein